MTTVCWDGTTIAADSLMTADSTIVDRNYKKIWKLEGIYREEKLICIGFAGQIANMERMFDQIVNGEDITENLHVQAIVITDKSVYTSDGGNLFPWTGKYLAIGSGDDFALSAMNLGLNALQAVKHAAKMDVYTGGKFYSMKVR